VFNLGLGLVLVSAAPLPGALEIGRIVPRESERVLLRR
jgi:hypothetical protein